MWSISLYKGTLSHENFVRERRGVLQLLKPHHAWYQNDEDERPGSLIRVLGGTSGNDVNKRLHCEKMGYAWNELDNSDEKWPSVLPGCLYYLQVEAEGEMIDCGSHVVALCRVIAMLADDSVKDAAMELDFLSTRKLRQMGIISEFGRIAESTC